MRTVVHRHLGKAVAGAAVAVAATAAMVAVTLPGTAGAGETGKAGGGQAAAGTPGTPAPGVVAPAPAEGAKGTGRDPLTDDEIERAGALAVDRRLTAAGENVTGGRGPQRLGTELSPPAAAELDDPRAPRRADVIFYDYRDDAVVTATVDLGTGKVEHTGRQHGVQPPLSRAESVEAARILIADPLGAGLRADYRDATGDTLTSPDQLLLDSMIYRAAPGAQPALLDRCGEHRCVRLFPKIRNGAWIDARAFVIDLSARKVGRLGA
ncbi:Tat pathway signal sequence domain protein [Streptomyces sp. NPDC046831]|uniref:Tat pathway signal sequence domain protein n=1 Tax=Streptomyces sp. NPDC046831 TaxID=3154805 RepID=UPI0033C28A24